MFVSITHKTFERDIQVEFETDAQTISVPMRIAYRDVNDKILTRLSEDSSSEIQASDEFHLEITDETESECVDVAIERETVTRSITMSFPESVEV